MTHWTKEEELELLHLRELGISLLDISEILDKTLSAVKSKSSRLIQDGTLNRRDTKVHKFTLKYTEEELINIVKQYVAAKEAPGDLRWQVLKYFGSWTEGLKAAGISGNIPGKFDPNKPTTLYFLDFGTHKKIGITQQQIKTRFSGAPPYTVLDSLTTDFDNAFYLEKELKKNLVQYIPEDPWFERNGKTECFQSDCITLEELL